jgi:hypothetical protein
LVQFTLWQGGRFHRTRAITLGAWEAGAAFAAGYLGTKPKV